MNKKELFNCRCNDFHHTIMIEYYDDQNENELCINIGLDQPLSFWRRVKIAFSYLFKLSNSFKWGYSNIILEDEDILRLSKVLSEYLEKKNV